MCVCKKKFVIMSEPPRCGCSCSVSKSQLSKAGAVLLLLASDMVLAIVLSKLFSESSFVFPLYLTLLHALLSCLLSALVLRTQVEGHNLPRIQPLPATWQNGLKILSQALTLALDIGLFNISLRYISLSLSMLARASIPLFTVLLSCLLYRQKRHLGVWCCVLGITGGMAASLYKNPQFQLLGFGLALGSALTEAVSMVLAEYIMLSVKLDPLNLLYYSALPSALFVLPFAVALEGEAVVHYVTHHFWINIFIVCSTSLLAFLLSLSRYQLMKLTSCVYTASVQSMRVVLTVIASEIIFYSVSQRLSLLNQAGIVVSLLCFLYLSFLDFSEDSYAMLPSMAAATTNSLVLRLGQKLKRLMRRNNFELLESNDFEQRFTIEDPDEEGEELDVICLDDDDNNNSLSELDYHSIRQGKLEEEDDNVL